MKSKEKNPPILTIGIIFKNEIRCLERCLNSLSPLREAVSCELIMADTGSDDGSHEVAARYADVLFDFVWADDFSAARNAVMDKAAGQWYMTVDADEYLGTDVTELAAFLQSKEALEKEGCTVIQRNYETYELNGQYSDFMAMRLLRMSTGLRYRGAIHESWHFTSGNQSIKNFSKTILHHDGYVNLNEEQGRTKRERNLALIKKALSKEPESLRNLLQYLESGAHEKDYTDILRHAAELVEKKRDYWECLGPSIFRYAVQEAKAQELPELKEWIERARKWFPDSFFTRVDVEYIAFTYSWEQKDYAACIREGERYLKAMEDYRAGRGDFAGMMYGSFYYGTIFCEQSLKIYLADAYIKENEPQRAARLLEGLDCASIHQDSTENLMRVLWKLHMGGTDTSRALVHFYEESQKPLPNEKAAKKRQRTFFNTALKIFMYREEKGKESTLTIPGRSPHTLFLSLGERCEPGLAAMVMEENDTGNMQRLLSAVENWGRFPIEALSHALRCGVPFPLSEKPLKLEEMDALTIRLAAEKGMLTFLLEQIKETDFSGERRDWQRLIWSRKLILLAVRTCSWKKEDISGQSSLDSIGGKTGLARLYADMEGIILPHYYTSELLRGENLFVLPVFDRFGWHYVQAFRELDAGNPAGYVHELKAGIKDCHEMTELVEYLIKHTPQLQNTPESIPTELLALAKQVKKLLSAYPADDPAVKAIRASEAYQKVSGLIEGNGIIE